MRRLILLSTLLAFVICTAYADKLTNIPSLVKQPDGTELNLLASGDEFFNFLHDKNGFTIIQHPENGYYYYGVREGDIVVPSEHRVNSVDPASVGLKPGAKISKRLYKERRDAFLAPMKTKGMTDAPTTGQVNQLSIYISFADDSVYKTPRATYFDPYQSMEQKSLKHYFHEVSYERLFVDTYHFPNSPDTINVTYVSEHPRAYFRPYSEGNPTGYTDGQRQFREHTLLRKAVEFVADQIPDDLDLDANNDGYVDNVCFTLKGGTTAWSTLLWPHRWSLSQEAKIGTLRVSDYLLMLEATFNVATLCHEFFHVLGAPDLYHYEETKDEKNQDMKACGPWDIMDVSSGHNYMGAFMKYKYGDWIDSPNEITESGSYSIYPLQNPDNNFYKIKSPLHPSEYFVVEYRKKEGLYESNIPSEGLLVYRINPNVGRGNADGPPDEVYIYRPNGTNKLNGNISGAPLGRDRFAMSDGTNPSSFLYNNGKGGKGGLDIANVLIHGDSITFEVVIPELFPPVDLTYTLSESTISFDWMNLYTKGFKNYNVYKNGTLIGQPVSSSFVDSNIDEGATYTYHVTASYLGGPEGESIPSNTVSITIRDILQLPYFEDFEKSDNGWQIRGSLNGFRWGNAEFHEMNTSNNTYFLAANSFATGYEANSKDMAITPRFNLSDYKSVSIDFDYTLKRINSADFLTVWVRKSPSDGWFEIYRMGLSGFGTQFVWRSISIEIPNEYYTDQFQIGFQYNDQNDISYGTGFDNFSIQGIRTGVENLSSSKSFSVFPNPSSGEFVLLLNGSGTSNTSIVTITDLNGKVVFEKEIQNVSGSHQESIDLNQWEDGIYVLILKTQTETYTEKLIKH